VAIAHNGVALNTTIGTASNQTYSTSQMTLTAGGSWNPVFGSSVTQPRVFNGSIYYTSQTGAAGYEQYGFGCYDLSIAFYESFQAGTFDLGGNPVNSISLTPNGSGGYGVAAGSNAWHTPTSSNLGLTDDSVSAAQTLPFVFHGPGISTNALYVGSNGRLWFTPQWNTSGSPTVTDLHNAGPSICPGWTDLDPSAGGTITAETDAGNGRFYVTWDHVPEWGSAANVATMQVEIRSSGAMEMRWRGMSINQGIITGFSQGNGAADPGSIDLSTSLPFDTGPYLAPLNLTASARPRLGTTVNLITSNLPGNSTIGVQVFSFLQHNPGNSLQQYGMPDCWQYVGFDSVLFVVPGNGTLNRSLPIPSTTSYVGAMLYSQAVVFASGFNPIGALTSNGLTLRLGSF
jgi:hypothetical protein